MGLSYLLSALFLLGDRAPAAVAAILLSDGVPFRRFRAAFEYLHHHRLATPALTAAMNQLLLALAAGTPDQVAATRAAVRALLLDLTFAPPRPELDYLIRLFNSSYQEGDEYIPAHPAMLLVSLAWSEAMAELYAWGTATGHAPAAAEARAVPVARQTALGVTRCGPTNVRWADAAEFREWIHNQF